MTTIPASAEVAREDLARIAVLAALEAQRIGQLELGEQPDDLLAHIGELNDLADLARWATAADDDAEFTEGALRALHVIRDLEAEDLRLLLEDEDTWHPDDRRVYEDAVELVDRVIETVA